MKVDKYVKDLFKRLDSILPSGAGIGDYYSHHNDDDSSSSSSSTGSRYKDPHDDEYYLDIHSEPLGFAYYRHVRFEKLDESRKDKIRNGYDIDKTSTQASSY